MRTATTEPFTLRLRALALRACATVCTLSLLLACSSSDSSSPSENTEVKEGACEVATPTSPPDFVQRVGCKADFDALASVPLDATIPGARSVKVVLDQLDLANENALYFQNSSKYKIHFEFASAHLSGKGPKGQTLPTITGISDFSQTEYYRTTRRFILGAVTYYEGPKVWALEIAPYDTASPAMIELLYTKVKSAGYFGPALRFHPTSDSVLATSKKLATTVKVVTTDEIYAGTDYQPLNLATTIGKVRFLTSAQLEETYVGFRDIVVLDSVPNDISVVAGLITEEFQTPLSHVNVLAQTRGTPNMGLRNARTNAKLKALEGKWAKLTVGASSWDAVEVTQQEADDWAEAHKPDPITLPPLNLSVTDLRDVKLLVDETGPGTLKDQISASIAAFGTKASNYGVLTNTPDVPIRPAFAIPAYYYDQFMRQNHFYERVDALLADPEFQADASVRDKKLAELRDEMTDGADVVIDQTFQTLLKAKLDKDFPGQTMRFRTSTNAEDLDGFPCAGCYESYTGDPTNWEGSLLRAIRKTWAGIWFFRTFEERSYHSIDHKTVAMSLLVHHNFPAEEANGVASTANPYDPTGSEPGFYINVQFGGDAEVVHPPPGVTSDQLIYFYDQPTVTPSYLAHSNLTVPKGSHVLTDSQLQELGAALKAIHSRFRPAYGPGVGLSDWYAMDVEFKFDDEGTADGKVHLWVKQARPYPGRGQ
ncbi:MAG: PEP/pyruvate-binding domain-containing protein [Myxococcota bacterium]